MYVGKFVDLEMKSEKKQQVISVISKKFLWIAHEF